MVRHGRFRRRHDPLEGLALPEMALTSFASLLEAVASNRVARIDRMEALGRLLRILVIERQALAELQAVEADANPAPRCGAVPVQVGTGFPAVGSGPPAVKSALQSQIRL
jgi:hypothetical protein